MNWLPFLRISGYALLLLGVICTIGVDYLKNKEDKKKDEINFKQMTTLITSVNDSKKIMEPFEQLATKLYPSLNQKDALESLKYRMDHLDQELLSGKEKVSAISTELRAEKNTIKTFEAAVYIRFSGNWNSEPYPLFYQSVQPMPFIEWLDNSRKNENIYFTSSRITFKTIDKKTAVFENILSVQPNKEPVGEMIDKLSQYNQMNFWFLFTNPKNLTNSTITIEEVKIAFLVNGINRGDLLAKSPQTMNLKDGLDKVDDAMPFINPRLSVTGQLTTLFHFKLE